MKETDEEKLCELLKQTDAYFILSTWHHNNYRENPLIEKLWKDFNIYTKEHFYHCGGKIENRQSMTEALICNFDIEKKRRLKDYIAFMDSKNRYGQYFTI